MSYAGPSGIASVSEVSYMKTTLIFNIACQSLNSGSVPTANLPQPLQPVRQPGQVLVASNATANIPRQTTLPNMKSPSPNLEHVKRPARRLEPPDGRSV